MIAQPLPGPPLPLRCAMVWNMFAMWRGSYRAGAMICAPSRSASRWSSRLYLQDIGPDSDL